MRCVPPAPALLSRAPRGSALALGRREPMLKANGRCNEWTAPTATHSSPFDGEHPPLLFGGGAAGGAGGSTPLLAIACSGGVLRWSAELEC